MSKTYVDLCEPINNEHFRYGGFIQQWEFTKDGKTKMVPYMNLSHGFTHIDAPRHMAPDGKVLEDFDLLSFLIGKASVLDVSHYIKPNQAITEEMVKEAFEGCEYTDFLLIKTSWGTQRSSSSPEFWSESPYITPEAVAFLVSLNPKVVGFDFPQDYAVRLGSGVPMTPETAPTHYQILPNDILMIEYMTNLWSIQEGIKNVDIYALPLKISVPDLDCAQIRVVAAY